jgi:DNA-binding NarL/FixJ family response regulator
VIKVTIVDDQTLVRQGIRSLLELAGDIQVVSEASDGEEAIGAIVKSNPDVILLDVRMPKKSGIDVLKTLRALQVDIPAILLTTFDEDAIVLDGVRAGAKGFLLKDVTKDQLTGAIRQLAAGGTLIQPAVTERIVRGLENVKRTFPSSDNPEALTDRETEIVRLMAAGYSNREIGEMLHVAEGTVKNHVSNVLSKMGVRDRTRAVLKAIELGYI